ncbi:MAG: transketolase C-terminal domain-containing protein, partial [Candidatus Nanopelagicales bacterium]
RLDPLHQLHQQVAVLGLDPERDFQIAANVLARAREVMDRGAQLHAEWQRTFDEWRSANPKRAALLDRLLARELPADLSGALPTFEAGTSIATRAASGKVINAIAEVMPEFWGGSADLAESNNTTIEGGLSFLPAGILAKDSSPYGRIIHFGIREHAMGAILNGIALEGLTRPFGGTFGLGEDGPTHQPVETLWALRAIPGLSIVRPCDGNETAAAWAESLRRGTPTGLILSRQGLPNLDRTVMAPAGETAKGAYTLVDGEGGDLRVVLLASGSEVQVALAARDLLQSEGIATRVVSVPCIEWFDDQDAAYRDSVLPKDAPVRVSVEAGATFGWWRLVGSSGGVVGIDHFGASADGKLLFEKFGITPDAVAQTARDCLAQEG